MTAVDGAPSQSEWDALSWEAKRGAVLTQALFTCELCGETAKEVDHIWPRSAGGSDRRENLRATCRPCNRRKGDRLYSEDIDANPSLALDGVRDAMRRAAVGISEAVRWTLYADVAALLGTRAIDDALAEDADGRAERTMAAVADAILAELDHTGPLSGGHAASMLLGEFFDGTIAELERA